MGVYSEYLDKLHDFQSMSAERKKQMQRIAKLRGRAILTIASDMGPDKANAPVGIDYTDLLPVADQLDVLSGNAIDVILETPGGIAERAEDIVCMIRAKFDDVAFIVPGAAMSAGTIMVMSGDEILLDPSSSLGPIDAQLMFGGGKRFSAEAFLEGLEKIKKEVQDTGTLNRAYIPILQGITPGEIQACQNAQDFSKKLVTKWLSSWKFRKWTKHSSNQQDVTGKDREKRAEEIASQLCNHSHWLTHGRSIKLDDLLAMRLKVTDYSQDAELFDAIRRYYTVLRMGFEGTAIYKIFETPTTQISRFLAPQAPSVPPPAGLPGSPDTAKIDVECPKCKSKVGVQADLGKKQPLQQGSLRFPKNNRLACPNCGIEIDLGPVRKQLEAQTKKPVIT